MKKSTLITLLTILCWCYASADINYKKFIEKHDVDTTTMKLVSDNPSDWWNAYIDGNMAYQEFQSNIKKKKGAEKEAQRITSLVPRFIPRLQSDVLDNANELCSTIQTAVGKDNDIELCIIDDPTFGAFSTYGEPGMTVVLHSGIFEAKGITDEIIIGIVAHEYAHCYLSHILQQEYSAAKKKRKNDLLVGFTQALNIIGAGADAYASAVAGTEANTDIYIQVSKDVQKKANLDLFAYYYKYAREQEFEADLIAYRFMEWAGYGGDTYIEALKIVEANEVYSRLFERIDDTHPTTRDRINFLEYVKEHPELINTNNGKIAKKRAERERIENDKNYDDIYR